MIDVVRGHSLIFAPCTPGDEKVVLHLDVPSARSASLSARETAGWESMSQQGGRPGMRSPIRQTRLPLNGERRGDEHQSEESRAARRANPMGPRCLRSLRRDSDERIAVADARV